MNIISLIIPHYGSISNTLECLESLKKQSIYFESKIYLTFEQGKEFEKDNFIKRFPRVIPVKLSRNLGFAGSVNAGLTHALLEESDIFITLNNDTILDSHCIENITNYSRQFPKGAIVSPKIYFYNGQEYHFDRYSEKERGKVIWYAGGKMDRENIYASHRGVDEVDCGQFEIPEETDFTTGCCMAIPRIILEKLGFFDENYFLYYEDVDYSYRCKEAGFEVLYYPKAFLWHKNAASSGKPGSTTHQYYQTRNRLYFGYKYASLRTRFALFRESVGMLFTGNIKRKAIIDYYMHHMGEKEGI